jgi:hypothetical protein
MNFATFFTQAVQDKTRKIKRGRYKGQSGGVKTKKTLVPPGEMFYRNPAKSDAPNASTFVAQG